MGFFAFGNDGKIRLILGTFRQVLTFFRLGGIINIISKNQVFSYFKEFSVMIALYNFYGLLLAIFGFLGMASEYLPKQAERTDLLLAMTGIFLSGVYFRWFAGRLRCQRNKKLATVNAVIIIIAVSFSLSACSSSPVGLERKTRQPLLGVSSKSAQAEAVESTEQKITEVQVTEFNKTPKSLKNSVVNVVLGKDAPAKLKTKYKYLFLSSEITSFNWQSYLTEHPQDAVVVSPLQSWLKVFSNNEPDANWFVSK